MKHSLLFIFALSCTVTAWAQKQITLNITHKLGANSFAFNQASKNNLNQDFKITRVDYYLSGFTIIHDGGMQTIVPVGTYVLAKGSSNVSANLGSHNVTNVEGIKFHIGIDSATNLSDPALYTSLHPLAPQSPSMHWGWASGFRFVALEGNAGSAFNTNFQLHGLFNSNYFEQVVMTPGVNTTGNVAINLLADFKEALREININAGPNNHGTNQNDLTMLKNFRDYVFSPNNEPASNSSIIAPAYFNVFPNPSEGILTIDLVNKYHQVTSIDLVDITGKLVQTIQVLNKSKIDLEVATNGNYVLKFYNQTQNIANQKIVIN